MRTRLSPAAHVGPLGLGALAEDGPPVQRHHPSCLPSSGPVGTPHQAVSARRLRCLLALLEHTCRHLVDSQRGSVLEAETEGASAFS